MTSNQVAYNTLRETKRHNVATETETNRSNLEREQQGRSQIAINQFIASEQQRHNLQSELLGRDTLNESIRHNVSVENETSRHNRQTEALGWGTLQEQRRHNVATESISRQGLTIQAQQVALGYEQLGETKLHNAAQEEIANRETSIKEARLPHDISESRSRKITNYLNSYSNLIGSVGSAARGIGSIIDGIIPG